MKGMHVHHRIPRSQGGTNDPSNLYVCSVWFHKNVWHAEDGYSSLIVYAKEGGEKAYRERKGIHGMSLEEKSAAGAAGGNAGGWRKSRESGKGIFGEREEWHDTYVECGREALRSLLENDPDHQRKAGQRGAQVSMERGVGINTPEARQKGGLKGGKRCAENGHMSRIRTPESIRKGGVAAGNSKWIDPDHPELGAHNAGVLVRKQRALGYPSCKRNRVKVG
jgi:hypothetical protein